MHAAFIFTAFFVFQVNAAYKVSDGQEFGSGSARASLRFQVVADAQLRQVVEATVAHIDKIARSPWTAEQKLTAIKLQYSKVQNYRASAWSRSPATEHKLDLLINPYESFPEAAQFRKQNCTSYYSTLKIDWEPTAKVAPTLTGVKRAWDNLKAICEG